MRRYFRGLHVVEFVGRRHQAAFVRQDERLNSWVILLCLFIFRFPAFPLSRFSSNHHLTGAAAAADDDFAGIFESPDDIDDALLCGLTRAPGPCIPCLP